MDEGRHSHHPGFRQGRFRHSVHRGVWSWSRMTLCTSHPGLVEGWTCLARTLRSSKGTAGAGDIPSTSSLVPRSGLSRSIAHAGDGSFNGS